MPRGAVQDLIESKAVKRGLSLKIFDWGAIEPAGGNTVRQVIGLRRGLPEDLAKKISKLIRDDFPKFHGQIQGDAVRVSGKSKDDSSGSSRGCARSGGVPRGAPVRELPLNAQGRAARIVMILIQVESSPCRSWSAP